VIPTSSFDEDAILDRLARALAFPEHRVVVTQEAFDDNHELLNIIARWRIDDVLLPEGALREYCLDIRWTEILQPDLLRKVLMMSARAWSLSIATAKYREYLGDLVSALCLRPGIIASTLGKMADRAFAHALMDLTLMWMSRESQIDEECDRWVPYYSSLGCLWANVREFHDRWLALNTAGLARCFVCWALMLCFSDADNPVFLSRRPRTPWDHLTSTDHFPWLPEKRFLDRDCMVRALNRCIDQLNDHERWLAAEARRCIEAGAPLLSARIADVLHNLAPGADEYWSHDFGIVR
jgi:hypothetical protein